MTVLKYWDGITWVPAVVGRVGSTGATGPANVLSIGTVTRGVTASATITGASPVQTLNLVLPQGDTGSVGNTGPAGATGPSNVLGIGTVVRGDTAAATITGVSPSQTLNLTLPKGDAGPAGVVIGTTPPSHDQLWADTNVTPALSELDGGTYATAQTVIKVRRGLSTQWVATTVLAAGEIGFETNTGKVKIGDGTKQWSVLDYISGSGGGGATSNDPVFTGAANFTALTLADFSGVDLVKFNNAPIEFTGSTFTGLVIDGGTA